MIVSVAVNVCILRSRFPQSVLSLPCSSYRAAKVRSTGVMPGVPPSETFWVAVKELNSKCYIGEPCELLFIPIVGTFFKFLNSNPALGGCLRTISSGCKGSPHSMGTFCREHFSIRLTDMLKERGSC